MIRGIDRHAGAGIARQDVGEREKDPGRRVPILGLQQYDAYRPPIELVPDLRLMVPSRHHDHSLPGREQGRAVERVLEHGAGPDEGAVLLRLGRSQPSPDECARPDSVPSRQYNRPQVPSCHLLLLSVVQFTDLVGSCLERTVRSEDEKPMNGP